MARNQDKLTPGIRLQDNSAVALDAAELFNVSARDRASASAQHAQQFLWLNRLMFETIQVTPSLVVERGQVLIRLQSENAIGSVPLRSEQCWLRSLPLTVQPRFSWRGLGSMLVQVGWRVVLETVAAPDLMHSERAIPAWVLSSLLLTRIERLLRITTRRFAIDAGLLTRPRGKILWSRYAVNQIARGQAQLVPCRYPELSADRQLLGAIGFAVSAIRAALIDQLAQFPFVRDLVERAESILGALGDVEYRPPSPALIRAWLTRAGRLPQEAQGVQAIQWAIENRGLAGTAEHEGVPWILRMDQFFEAWVETIMERVARSSGARLRVGRRRETIHQVSWEPLAGENQRALIPDLWVEWPGAVMIVDAKYKRYHAGSIAVDREARRQDLLQILAYSTLTNAPIVIACLAYAVDLEEYASLQIQGRHISRAEIVHGSRQVMAWMLAIPMTADCREVIDDILFYVNRTVGP